MFKNSKNLFLIVKIVAVFIIISLGIGLFVRLKLQPQQPKVQTVGQAERPVLREEAQKIKKGMTATDKKIGDLTILDNKTAKITYLISNDQFIVEIKEAPFEDGKKQIESWFINKGFTQGELCVLRISFGTSKTIKPNLTSSEILPLGCSN
ncbi:hypothetical protein A2W70_02485 [Candidatus Curtissbacteria bacterium RIFCSPLOWO2_02_41_11]|uniref:Uncharacterized protein n=2 Tax=Candidatus Curtissiibacteriota TaxID=1752717 RepID=A0A1F5HTY9_9BACT|nr:MAG: hypothetical protein UU56_C0015G0002 [Candidatus Curtissbacteria bacterium GW2011_GWA2_41_24]OGE07631.1 MAG: hypothetical protein A2W70_02485 [Candidatus Curtissbacteria bacterium RIFCSPLOWO2_02_41_11]